MRVLMRFSKDDSIKYISHLDMQRLFQRALRRAKLPCAYSQGFNPHLLIGFACALPVGVCSESEYVEFQLESFVHPSECMKRLNAVLPSGVRILNATEPADSFPTVASVIALAEYTLVPKENRDFGEIISGLLAQPSIEIEKKTKRGMENVDVRPFIHRLKQTESGIKATLSCSNTENLRGDKLKEILEANGIGIASVTRNSIFIIHNNAIIEPLEASV